MLLKEQLTRYSNQDRIMIVEDKQIYYMGEVGNLTPSTLDSEVVQTMPANFNGISFQEFEIRRK